MTVFRSTLADFSSLSAGSTHKCIRGGRKAEIRRRSAENGHVNLLGPILTEQFLIADKNKQSFNNQHVVFVHRFLILSKLYL
jgi:hypothetical protein